MKRLERNKRGTTKTEILGDAEDSVAQCGIAALRAGLHSTTNFETLHVSLDQLGSKFPFLPLKRG